MYYWTDWKINFFFRDTLVIDTYVAIRSISTVYKHIHVDMCKLK